MISYLIIFMIFFGILSYLIKYKFRKFNNKNRYSIKFDKKNYLFVGFQDLKEIKIQKMP